MGAREAGGRLCAAVRCVSCVQSSDMLAEPPNTDPTRPWPIGVAAAQGLTGGEGFHYLDSRPLSVCTWRWEELRVAAKKSCNSLPLGFISGI